MFKPRLFKIHIALEASGYGALAVAAATHARGKTTAASILSMAGVSLLGSATALGAVRAEKEAQRNAGRAGEQRSAFNKLAGDIAASKLSPKKMSNDMLAKQMEDFERKLERIAAQFEEGGGSIGRFSVSASSQSPSLKLDFALPSFAYLRARKQVAEISIQVNECSGLKLDIFARTDSEKTNGKAGLVAFTAYDEAGKPVQAPLTPSKSDRFGYFCYLSAGPQDTINEVTVRFPAEVYTIRAEIHSWTDDLYLQNEILIESFGNGDDRVLTDLRVASVLDEFSFQSFEHECNLLALDPSNWKKQMDEFRPDLFLCESAWSGTDSDSRPWKGRVYTSVNFRGENRGELLDILAYCNERRIPTVFWNKEDPSHYDDRVHDFVDTALRFDHIFTTDINCVRRYELEHGHSSVDVLPFAVQPRLFNPKEIAPRSEAVVFAGGWYENHNQRSKDTVTMFDAVLKSGHKLKIYDRFYFFEDDETHRFPEEYTKFTNPAVPASDMPSVYKESRFGMTLNTETKSPTMFARRIFELMACNTYVVSNFSNGIAEMFPGTVSFLDEDPEALNRLTDSEIDAARQANLLEVLEHHTYRNRFRTIVEATGIAVANDHAEASVAVLVETAQDASRAFEILRRLSSELVSSKILLVTEGAARLEYSAWLRAYNRDGVCVVWLPSVLDGEVNSSEAFGDASSVLLMTATELSKRERDIAGRIKRFELHAQYTDLPMITEGWGVERYTEAIGVNPEEIYLPRKRALEVITSIGEGTDFTVYAVEEI